MHIVTDTCAYFATPRFAKAHDVTVMPIRIRLGDEVVREDEITALELFDAVVRRGVIPELIPPTQQEFATTFEAITRHDNVIMSIHCTDHLCPMPTQARLGADLVRGRTTVHVIDTGSVSLGQGLVVEAAVKASEAGLTLEDAIKLARGKSVNWLGLILKLTLVAGAGLFGGGLGALLRRRGFVPSTERSAR